MVVEAPGIGAAGPDADPPVAPQTGRMAHFRTSLSSTAPAQAVLDHLADFASIAGWDPGVTEARLISGEPGAEGARYALVAQFGLRRLRLEYEIVERQDPAGNGPGHVTLVAEAGSFTSRDTITVLPGPLGAQVDYDAELTLHGPGRVLDLPLHLAFQVIGRRAEAGLRQELARLGAAAGSRP